MRYRAFMIILYSDDETHMNALNYIEENYDKYAYILHDNDYNEVGELKKEHYHVIIKLANAKTISALSKDLNIKENYIEPTKKSYIYGLKYLIHYNDNDKQQYDIDCVVGPLKQDLKKSLDNEKTENEYILDIINFIEQMEYINLIDFVKVMCANGLYSHYRRSAFTFNQIINEHNIEALRNRNHTS